MGVTVLGSDITYTERQKIYDAVAKKLLSNKPILAWIMKECIQDYHSLCIDDIIQCIEGIPEVGTSSVHQDTGDPGRILGLSTEDTSISEGIVRYDIRFYAIHPTLNDRVSCIINIEAQLNDTPGYPLVKRGIYYCSRLISSQHGTVFTNSDYGKIKKVYSIFICLMPAQKRQNSIVRYELQESVQVGQSDVDKSVYDLISLIMIYMGDESNEKDSQILRILKVLFTDSYTKDERFQILENEYGISVNYPVIELPRASEFRLLRSYYLRVRP